MEIENEKWAIFWCDLLKSIIFSEIEAGENHAHLVSLAATPCLFPNGQWRKPSLSTLKRKLKAYQQGGFNALLKRARCDRGQPRAFSKEVLEKAVELKKEQPRRSVITINRLLNDQFGVTMPSTTLHRYLKEGGATRLKLGCSGKKVRKRWGRDHTHELWLGDFAEGPYISHQGQVVPTQLAVIMDCHSRYGVSARYYLRQNLDVLIDVLLRGLAAFTSAELESLKKTYQGNAQLNRASLTQAFERATHKSLPFIIHEINQLKKEN